MSKKLILLLAVFAILTGCFTAWYLFDGATMVLVQVAWIVACLLIENKLLNV